MAVRHHARLSAHSHLTLREWAELPEDVDGELVDGRLEEEEMANRAHERTVTWLSWRLMDWLGDREGDVTGSDHKYGVGSKRGRKPDISVFLPGRPELDGADRITMVPPDIVVEVISPTPRDIARDRIDKAREYSRFGVRWYWLVDPAGRTLEIYELGHKGRYVRAGAASGGRMTVPGCRGLKLDLDALWRYAHR